MNIPNLWRTRLQRYRLCSTYCVACGAVFFPPRPACPHCRLTMSVIVQTETARLLLATPPAPAGTDLAWPQPYALTLFETHPT